MVDFVKEADNYLKSHLETKATTNIYVANALGILRAVFMVVLTKDSEKCYVEVTRLEDETMYMTVYKHTQAN